MIQNRVPIRLDPERNEPAALLNIGQAKLIGAKASELLTAPEYTGRVLAIVSKAVYLTDPGGEILWLAQEQLPAHSRGILGSFSLTALREGQPFHRHAQSACLQFGNRASVDLADAAVWEPKALQPGQLAEREIVSARARQLLGVVQSNHMRLPFHNCDHSLWQAILPVGAIANGGDATGVASSSSLVALALSPIREIALACRDRDMARVVEAGRALVGLGPGLTPSGDDFLGGLFFVVYHLSAAYPGEFHRDQQPINALLNWARAQTNPISHAILRDHVGGHGAEPLHDLVTAILQGREPDAILTHVQQLLEIGSTSGWDMLAGAVTGMLLLAAA